ncbi:hypothetical protein [[Eubacterium] cellulosolvens]
MDSKLAEWEIEIHEFQGPRLPPWSSQLTDEQKEEIKTMIKELRETCNQRRDQRSGQKEIRGMEYRPSREATINLRMTKTIFNSPSTSLE